MVPNNGIHRINSCKINMDFGGGPTFLTSSLILVQMRCLFDIWLILIPFCDTWDYFAPIIELTLFLKKCWCLLPKYALYHLFSEFYEHICYYELCPCLILFLDSLMFFWFALIKACCVSYFWTNFDILWW